MGFHSTVFDTVRGNIFLSLCFAGVFPIPTKKNDPILQWHVWSLAWKRIVSVWYHQ